MTRPNKLATLAAGLVLLLAAAPAVADVTESVVRIETTYRTCSQNACLMAADHGSAVYIGDHEGRPVFATCYHCVKHAAANQPGTSLRIKTPAGAYDAHILGHWGAADLALVKTRATLRDQIEPAELDEAPADVSSVDMVGFPAGRFQKIRAAVRSRDTHQNLITDQPAAQGTSGGALFSGDRLAGIVWGTSGNQAYARPVANVAHLCRLYKVKLKIRARGLASAPLPPAPAPPLPDAPPFVPPTSWYPDPGLTLQLQEIANRLNALEKSREPTAGPAGPAGPTGPRGPAGEAPPNALTALEKRLAHLEARPIRVQLLESGQIISDQTYAPDSPIKLEFGESGTPPKKE